MTPLPLSTSHVLTSSSTGKCFFKRSALCHRREVHEQQNGGQKYKMGEGAVPGEKSEGAADGTWCGAVCVVP